MDARPPLPPFTAESAGVRVRKAEDAWNSRDPERCALACTEDSAWRNRAEFFSRGLRRRRQASINHVPITEAERRDRWPLDQPRPEEPVP